MAAGQGEQQEQGAHGADETPFALNAAPTGGYTGRSAQPGNAVSDIFDEVDEELRADRAQQWLKKYGSLLIAAGVLVVLGVAGMQGWNWWQARKAGQAAEAYLAATASAIAQGADPKAAADGFAALVPAAPEGYRELARLRAAALRQQAGDTAGALALWDEAAKDSRAETLYRELATLLWGLHALGTVDPAQIEARLAPLASPANPWHASAQEVRALAALQRGDAAAARQGLEALANDVTAPQGVRERAGRLLPGLGG